MNNNKEIVVLTAKQSRDLEGIITIGKEYIAINGI